MGCSSISRSTFGLIAGAVALAVVGGCKPSTTAVRINVTYVDTDVRQIEFTLLADDRATEIVAPMPRPLSPGQPLPSPQSVVVLLPDRAATVIARARLLTTPDQTREASTDVRPHA